jgi:FAD/FMN-containing dehydrogenase
MPQKTLTITPRSAAEAAEALRSYSAEAASGRSVRVAVLESPFRPEAGGVPCDELVLASHAGMGGIHEVSKGDFLAVVGGGASFGALAEAAGAAGLSFPHEPGPETRGMTVAGIIMGGMTFRTETRYGRLREYILALELATPAGEIVRTGSRSVKDVTGYDIAGFLMGGGGRCGMIAKATMRLLSAPGSRLGFACDGSREALETLSERIRLRLAPAFVELAGAGQGPEGSIETLEPAARLIGELQSAVGGREEALLGSLSTLADDSVRISRLDLAALAGMGSGGGVVPARRESGRVLRELEERVRRVFDPEGIMLP